MNRKSAAAAVLGCALLAAPVSATTVPAEAEPAVVDVPESALVATAADAGQDPVVVPAAATARDWAGQAAAATDPEQVPTVVLDAYTTAVAVAPADCSITVPLLAAVGQVESGNLVGRSLDASHAVTPALVGPRLDGGAFASIRDTDNGRLDGDRKFDRAVGPMQFLPSTWRSVGVDMDGDGERDPQNIYDAAGAAMVYLCGTRDLSDPAQLRQAILSYNRSTAYLQQVMTWKATFETEGLGAIASLPIFSASSAGTVAAVTGADAATLDAAGVRPRQAGTRPRPAGSSDSAGTPTATGTPGKPTTPAKPGKPGTGTATPGAGKPTTGTPTVTPSPSDPTSGTPSPSDPTSGTPTPTPTPDPTPPPSPEPTYVADTEPELLSTECEVDVDQPVTEEFFLGLVWSDVEQRLAVHVDGLLFPDETTEASVDTLCLDPEE